MNIQITEADIGLGDAKRLLRPSRQASRGVLYNGEGKIALLLMKPSGCYKLPGGGVEKGESPADAFLRETREETGYRSKITAYFGTIEEHKYRNHFFQLSHCFAAKAVGAPGSTHLTRAERRLGFSLEWMRPDSAVAMMEDMFHQRTEYSLRFLLLREKAIISNYLYLQEKNSLKTH